jgi:proline iminopeptidase
VLQASPSAAHDYLPDAEADARNDSIQGRAWPALHPRPVQAVGPTRRSGFYRLQYPQSPNRAPPRPDPRPALTGLPTPVLIVKASCDYLSWHSAIDDEQALPQHTLVYLRGAGHNV